MAILAPRAITATVTGTQYKNNQPKFAIARMSEKIELGEASLDECSTTVVA
jgi:hypothetical protein